MNNRVFCIDDNRLKLISLKITIPEDEPVFILRARDKQALSTIRVYQSTFAPTSEHWGVIQNVIEDFTEFRQKNSVLMGDSPEVY